MAHTAAIATAAPLARSAVSLILRIIVILAPSPFLILLLFMLIPNPRS